MKHLADEFDPWRFVRILLFKVHDQTEGSIFERCIRRSYDHSVPSFMYVSPFGPQILCTSRDAYQVMTLSAIGDAETPAGGSVCIRWIDHLLATALTLMLLVALKDYKGVAMSRTKRLLGHSTLKSRMSRLRAGVVILNLDSNMKLHSRYEEFGIVALMLGCSRGDGC